MTKLQEIANLTALELDLIQFGKIEKRVEHEPFETIYDSERLKRFHFDELQEKYLYGWYIAEQTLEEQIKSIDEFKLYILENYKED